MNIFEPDKQNSDLKLSEQFSAYHIICFLEFIYQLKINYLQLSIPTKIIQRGEKTDLTTDDFPLYSDDICLSEWHFQGSELLRRH